jgi:hypothetical protein
MTGAIGVMDSVCFKQEDVPKQTTEVMMSVLKNFMVKNHKIAGEDIK